MDRYQFENSLWQQGYQRIMGLDEVGRGCLCGPVVAAGVILKPSSKLRGSGLGGKAKGKSVPVTAFLGFRIPKKTGLKAGLVEWGGKVGGKVRLDFTVVVSTTV